MSLASLKRRTHEVFEGTRPSDRLSQAVQWFLVVLIVSNVAAFVLATMPQVQERYASFFLWFERLSVAVFTVEYLLRVWACTEDERFRGPVLGRLRFMATPAALIDLLAIAPFYLPRLVGTLDLRAARALRLFRLLRLLKLGRFSQSVAVFSSVMKNKREQLLIAGIAVSILLVLASSLMYVAEHRVQPEAFSSIPAALWWGVVTLTTVGYGDVTPVTTPGRLLGGFIAVLGIGLFALPAGILSSGFEEALEQFQDDEGDVGAAGVAGAQAERQDDAPQQDAPQQDAPQQDAPQQDAPGRDLRYCPRCGKHLAD